MTAKIVNLVSHPLVQHKLSLMRDKGRSTKGFVHDANIEHYRRLLAASKRDPSRDENRHNMLLTLLAEEEAKDKMPRNGSSLANT